MAQSFKSAFADARRKGRKTFPWKGKQYTTELADGGSRISPTSRPSTTKIRSVGNGRETARGQGVAQDIAAASVGRPDRGGILAAERGATVKGYEGTVTPGQRRGFEQTREAGKFPVYGKQMQAGQSFRGAFADARKSGKKTFTWQGRKYTTDLA